MASSRSLRITGALTTIVIALWLGKLLSRASSETDGQTAVAARKRVLLSEKFSFAEISLEKRDGLPLHWLVIKARNSKAADADVTNALVTIKSILDRKLPMTVHYDVRGVGMVLSRKQLWDGIMWTRANGALLDERLQCIAMTMKPGFVYATAWFFVKVNSPPQPVHVGTDEASALRFSAEKCRSVRDYRASSAARLEARRAKERQKVKSATADDEGGQEDGGLGARLLSSISFGRIGWVGARSTRVAAKKSHM